MPTRCLLASRGSLHWTTYYRDEIGFVASLEEVEYDRKRLVERTLFPGEIGNLGATLAAVAEDDRYARDLSPRGITRALREITASLKHTGRTFATNMYRRSIEPG